MKNCTKKLTYFSCSFFLIHTKQTRKIKKHFRKNKNKRFIFNVEEKKGYLFDLYVSLIEELQKLKSI